MSRLSARVAVSCTGGMIEIHFIERDAPLYLSVSRSCAGVSLPCETIVCLTHSAGMTLASDVEHARYCQSD